MKTFIDQNLITQWGITKESTKRFSFPRRGKTKELQRRKETKKTL